jgi:pimeloyl-ACP methyl ester carboxylesterase
MVDAVAVRQGESVVDGVMLRYAVRGNGKPLLLLHGFGANIGNWRFIAPSLARSHEVWMLDLKGHGGSEKPDDNAYSLYDQARLVVGFIKQQGLSQLSLVGHSYGGGVALLTTLSLLEETGETLQRLVLIGSVAYPQSLPFFIRLLKHPWLGRLGLALSPARLASYLVLHMAYFDHRKISSESVEYYAAPLRQSGGQKALIATAGQIIPREFDALVSRYQEIRLPTLLIWGDHDRIVPLENGRRLREAIQGSRLEIVQRCGHIPQEEQPAPLLGLLEPFLGLATTGSG